MRGRNWWRRCSLLSRMYRHSDPAPWEATPRLGSQSFPAEHGIPPRIVLYRMPLQSHARSRMDLQFAIRDEVVLRLAELYGRRPEEIDPDWGM